MKLSRTVTYALKATLQLAQNSPSGPVPCGRLAAQGAMPERFLLQILRSLVTHGILKSTRGVDGGYVLWKEPTEVSVLDVIEAIEGPFSHEVAFGEGLSERTQNQLGTILEEVTESVRTKLANVKLSDLIDDSVADCQSSKPEAARIDQPTADGSPVPNPVITSRPDVLGSNPTSPAFNPNSGASF